MTTESDFEVVNMTDPDQELETKEVGGRFSVTTAKKDKIDRHIVLDESKNETIESNDISQSGRIQKHPTKVLRKLILLMMCEYVSIFFPTWPRFETCKSGKKEKALDGQLSWFVKIHTKVAKKERKKASGWVGKSGKKEFGKTAEISRS